MKCPQLDFEGGDGEENGTEGSLHTGNTTSIGIGCFLFKRAKNIFEAFQFSSITVLSWCQLGHGAREFLSTHMFLARRRSTK